MIGIFEKALVSTPNDSELYVQYILFRILWLSCILLRDNMDKL